MIPRNLPALTAAAIRHGWDVDITHEPRLVEAHFDRAGEDISLIWDHTGLGWSAINSTPTPYAQCARLIRSKEN